MIKDKLLNIVSSIVIWLWAYFSPTFPMILSIGFFIACDTITGLVAATRNKEKIESKKLRDGVFKFIQYGIAVLVAHVIETLFVPQFPAMKVISGFLAYIELKSMNENIEKSHGINVFKLILEKLKR